jgi:integrase
MKRVDGFTNLYLRGGAFIVRVQVPERDREGVGARELKRSLGGDFASAKKKYPFVLAELHAKAAPTGEVQAARGLHVPSEAEIDAAALAYNTALRDNLARGGPNDDGTWDPRKVQATTLADIAEWQAGSDNAAAMALQARWLCDERGWDVDDANPKFEEICLKLLRARLDRLRQAQHKASGLFGPRQNADPMFAPATPNLEEHSELKTVGQLIAEFRRLREPTLAPSTQQGYRITLRALEEILGADCVLKNLSRERCREVRDTLAALPANYRKLRQTKNLSLREAGEISSRLGFPTVKPATLNGYLNKMRALFALAVQEHWLDANPAIGLVVADPVSPAEKRYPFSPVQLQQIFAGEPWFSNDRDVGGRPARFWLPLLALYTGARIGELAQLSVADVARRNDVDFINIRSTDETRLKNRNAERAIPVHPELVRLGFLDYVSEARASGRGRLFPQERRDALGHHGRGVSDWFAKLLDKHGLTDSKLTFHSFRHNFEDALREADLHGTPIAAYLTGRSGGGSSTIYGGGYSTARLREAIALVTYPGLDLSRLRVDESDTGTPPA